MNGLTEGDWKAVRRPETEHMPENYEIHFSEDGECVAEVVHGEANARLMAESKKMHEIVKAVAHIGVDFGYGKFELTEDHIKQAREIFEKLDD